MLDACGIRAAAVTDRTDPNRLDVTLPSGRHVLVPRSLVEHTAEGFRYARAFDAPRVAQTSGNQLKLEGQEGSLEIVEETFEALEESLHVNKVPVIRDHVRVTTHVSTRDEVVELETNNEEVSIERVAIGRIVDVAAAPRTEGDTLIVPVYEEIYVVEKRLVLREEVRVTRSLSRQTRSETVTLRSEQVLVEHIDDAPQAQTLGSETPQQPENEGIAWQKH